jgi:hypothetical protein
MIVERQQNKNKNKNKNPSQYVTAVINQTNQQSAISNQQSAAAGSRVTNKNKKLCSIQHGFIGAWAILEQKLLLLEE